MASSSGWTLKQNNDFEDALAMFEEATPNRWENIARAVGGGKTVEDVKRHFKELLDDAKKINSGELDSPKYRTPGQNGHGNMADEE